MCSLSEKNEINYSRLYFFIGLLLNFILHLLYVIVVVWTFYYPITCYYLIVLF